MTDHAASDAPPRALVFDVFGTVVDWHGSIAREAQTLFHERGIAVDPVAFTEAWRAGYQPAMHRVRTGDLPWMKIDDLHRLILDDLVARFAITGLSEADLAQFNRVWHRLDPWPDAVEGLGLLKRRFTIATLSNGNFALLTNMAKRAGLPWDCVISAELFHHYKPDPETYRGAADLLGIAHGELMLVACHPDDLRAAQRAGLRAAYVKRPAEHGIGSAPPAYADGEFDDVADDFVDLARRFEARWFAVR